MVCGSLHLQAFVGSADLGSVGKGLLELCGLERLIGLRLAVCREPFEQLPHKIWSFGLHVHNVPFVALR